MAATSAARGPAAFTTQSASIAVPSSQQLAGPMSFSSPAVSTYSAAHRERLELRGADYGCGQGCRTRDDVA
jgi:hypothetical protein